MSFATSASSGEQCCVLLPKAKIESFPEGFGKFLRQLRSEFGGYTYDREVNGSWIERTAGIVHDDRSVVILVEIPLLPVSRKTLEKVISYVARDLNELSLFVSVSGGATFFVWAAAEAERSSEGGQLAA
jgi:hypothetical protein